MLRLTLPITYRGWSVHHDFVGYSAISDNYDADWMGEEIGWEDNGERVWASSLPSLYYEIDIKIEEGAK